MDESRQNKVDINEELLKPYNPSEKEDAVYKAWEESGFFNPDKCVESGITKPDAPTFSIVLPPPNVTGTLHIGSAYMLAIQDTLVRFARMNGKRTLWIPGTDHAAIATQSKVESIIYKEEKLRRHDLGREEFLKRVEKFAKESRDTIVTQIRKTGCSIDWSREAFTLDEKRTFAVKTAFKKMYDDSLIYRGYRIINWDPKGQTTISDDEIVYKPQKGKIYTFKYSKDFPISIATTRPETKVGDTAVAVHPDDARYKKYIGKEFKTSFCGVPLEIKIVGDKAVDPSFGTGAVGVTPAHSVVDYEMAERHKLPLIQVIDEYARMMVDTPELKNKKIAEAREIIIDWLKKEGLLEKEEEVENNLATAERTGGIVEPLPKMQWFIDVNKRFKIKESRLKNIKKGQKVSLKELMMSAVKNGDIKIIPERFEKTYYHWIENLRDWCISRQIWYGHQVPVWYRSTDTSDKPEGVPSGIPGIEMYCDIEPPQGKEWVQDPDTLDTWFSSGLWTFSTLGWPTSTPDNPSGQSGPENDFANYHPTTVLETGYDILPFWVARMILMSTYLLGDIPFKTVYLHGLVRDKEGNKISKSLGNNIDPIIVMEKYGADALRMSLLVGTGPGNDSKMSEEKLKAYKHFANKIWNIARFILSNSTDIVSPPQKITENDKIILEEFEKFSAEMTEDIEEYRLHIAAEKIYHFLWHRLADVIIEESKPLLAEEADKEIANSRKYVLRHILENSIKLLHPFMPFITEILWQIMNKEKNRLLMTENWPIKKS